ncbi:MOSC domain-containing protein [Halosolutus gelatinilyticus]|uniref:MOSC domain-containing protein n=1 Tax=Halosolutus gelatinilyticus TaxID=2931975 RepID=UPI001FF1E6D1|nr:MOSC N-terminal beta barrel domain-containing protein [Halosolutus gelatinilyticus]
MATLDRIRVHPVKALDATTVESTTIVETGALEWDRRYAIVESTERPRLGEAPHGAYVNGKREERVHDLAAVYDLDRETITVSERGVDEGHAFHLELDRDCLSSWLSDFFGYPVELVRNDEGGFPDDADASGPTIIGDGTIEAVASWYDGIDPSEMRRRLRPNLVVGDVPAFWEDRLYDEPGRVVPFEIGPARLHGVNPCQRCVVPTRDPDTGEETEGFQETFVSRREETLPEWATDDRFDHYFRLMVNTRAPDSSWGTPLSVGDAVTIGEPVSEPSAGAP